MLDRPSLLEGYGYTRIDIARSQSFDDILVYAIKMSYVQAVRQTLEKKKNAFHIVNLLTN